MIWHRPEAYRYRCATQRTQVMLNRYGWKVIGVAVGWRGWSYCLKWAWAA